MSSSVLATVMDVVRPFVRSGDELTPETPLMASGTIDSASMVNILMELEGRLGILLDAADLSFDHFQDCQTLANVLSERVSRD